MRIGMVVPGFSAEERDWCIPALSDLVRVLARDHTVHVVPIRYPYRRNPYDVHGARVRPLGGALASGAGRLLLLGRAVLTVAALARRERLDVLHGLWADEPGTVAVLAARIACRPAVVSLMGGELVAIDDIGYGVQRHLTGRLLVRTALSAATLATAGSAFMVGLAAERGFRGTVNRLPLGVETERFRPDGEAERLRGRPRLLHVGSLSPVKDQTLLLDALSRVTSRLPDVHLHVVGTGPLRASLERQAATLGLTSHVTFHGHVPHDRLPAYYRTSDLVVVSSRFESQSMVVLEAAACGVPVVGTAVGILPELAPATRAVPVGEAQALAEAIAACAADPALLAGMRRDGLGLIRREYAIETAVARLVTHYTAR